MRNQYGESYTTEEKKWARKFFKTHKLTETTIAFNKKFGRNKTKNAIHHLCRGVKTNFYTKEMMDFLKVQATITNNTWNKITKAFNETFKSILKRPIKVSALRKRANDLGLQTKIHRNDDFIYIHPAKWKIGDEVIRTKKGTNEKYIYVKITDAFKDDKKCWQKKHYLVWEKHYGKVPKDHFILFLDGNSLNCDISNLRCVPKSFSIALNGGKTKESFYGLGEITDTYIEILKARNTIKEITHE